MTIKEYFDSQLAPFGIMDSTPFWHYIPQLYAEDVVNKENMNEVGLGLTEMIEGLLFAPRQSSISEQGFSVTWDFSNLGRYYMWLCRKYGKTPSKDVTDLLGISMIIDKTDIW